MEAGTQELKLAVDSIYQLTPEAWIDFADLWTVHTVKRKEIMTSAGEHERYLYFVVEGVQRIFYLDDKDREATLVLTYAPSFGGVLDSFLQQKPSLYYYEALTPSRFLRSSWEQVHKCMQRHASVSEMIRKGISQSLSGVLARMVELQCYSSEDKFRQLLKRSPHILTLVPHKYLANYLGIDPTNFSKLINSVRI
ncbi:MAG: Crp/Fnr family transcriptional regulator [Cyclobacteriaceae bacterium]|nr:Crp/Fnr family transcriptional regulator [Cyclobacteriaceae bacterium]